MSSCDCSAPSAAALNAAALQLALTTPQAGNCPIDICPGASLVGDACAGVNGKPIPIPLGAGGLVGFPGPPYQYPLIYTPGDSLSLLFVVVTSATLFNGEITGTGKIDLTGLEGDACISATPGDPIVTEITVDVDQTASPSATVGQILITATGSQTILFPQFGSWSLELGDGTATLRKTIVSGPLCPNLSRVCL